MGGMDRGTIAGPRAAYWRRLLWSYGTAVAVTAMAWVALLLVGQDGDGWGAAFFVTVFLPVAAIMLLPVQAVATWLSRYIDGRLLAFSNAFLAILPPLLFRLAPGLAEPTAEALSGFFAVAMAAGGFIGGCVLGFPRADRSGGR